MYALDTSAREDLHTVRYLLQQAILTCQELMRDHPDSARLQHTLKMLWATLEQLA